MAITYWPFAEQEITDGQFEEWTDAFRGDGLKGVTADDESPLQVIGDSTGMNVKVQPGSGYIRGRVFRSTAQERLTINAASSLPRVDLIVMRLDRSQKIIGLTVKTGTPAASPSEPTLTQTNGGVWEVPLARVSVAANAVTIAAGNVADLRWRLEGGPEYPLPDYSTWISYPDAKYKKPGLSVRHGKICLSSGFIGRGSPGTSLAAGSAYPFAPAGIIPVGMRPRFNEKTSGSIHYGSAIPTPGVVRIGVDGTIAFIPTSGGSLGTTSGSYLETDEASWRPTAS